MQNLLYEWLDYLDGGRIDVPLGDGDFPSANAYIIAGIRPEQYKQWYSVNGFDIDCMKQLEQAGIPLSELGKKTDAGFMVYTDTIAYKFCNGDLSLEEVKFLTNSL